MTTARDATSRVKTCGSDDQNDSTQKGNMAGNPRKREEFQTLNSQPHWHIFAQVGRPAGFFPAGRLRGRYCAIGPPANPRSLAYEPPSCVLTFENVADAFVPTAWMAVRQTTMIRASITAYSTAVGPSSETIKRLTFRASSFMVCPLMK